MPIGLGNALSMTFRTGKVYKPIVVTDEWILETGFWNSGGIWKDTSVWID